MRIRYLEIVTPDVEDVCATYVAACGAEFSPPVAELGNARTAAMPDGSMVGVRAPMHETEVPVVRPYWLVEDIQAAWDAALAAGAQEMHPPLQVPGRGTFAIYMQGTHQVGLWQD
jgi:predicted enzyme related to lactoylglutathione lyase